MKLRSIGDRPVSAIGLGTARLSLADRTDDSAAIAHIRSAIDMGFSYLDTAMAYTTDDHPSHSESLIARALAGSVPEVLVGTKGGHFRRGSEWFIDGRPESLRRNCEASLRALAVDVLGLYYLHFPDPAVPFEDSVGALAELQNEGKIRQIGISNVSLDEVRLASSVCGITAVQNPLSPFHPEQREIAEFCESTGIAFVAYSPLGGDRRPRELDQLSPTANTVAMRHGTALGTVWLAWLLHLSSSVIPLTGARQNATLAASRDAKKLDLTVHELHAIDTELRSVQTPEG